MLLSLIYPFFSKLRRESITIEFLFSACDTGTSDNGVVTDGEKLNAIGLDCTTFTLDTTAESRSVRSVVQGGVYGFTIITPIQGGSGFDPVQINVTVQNIEPLGNGKEKVTLMRDNGGTFYITFDSNGELIGIQGLAGARTVF